MKNPEVSIIIPVYGVEDYIDKCLKSVLNQSFQNFECLIVNDGSPDDSIAIARKTVGNDDRFVFLEKENGGLASARNYGLNYATGEYIAFIDSDDYVEQGFISIPLQILKKEQTDICMLGINYVDSDGLVIFSDSNDVVAYYDENDFLVSKNTVTQFAWSKICSRKVFDRIRFNEDIITFEDVYINFRILYGMNISNVEKPLYNYLQRPGTLSKDIKPTFINDRFAISEAQKEFINEHNLTSEHNAYIQYTYLKTFVFFTSAKLSRYSKFYNSDVAKLMSLVDKDIFSFKNIFRTLRYDKKVGLSLILFKLSPFAFKVFSRFWFRNYVA